MKLIVKKNNKAKREKEGNEIRAEINKTESKKQHKRSIKPRAGSLKR